MRVKTSKHKILNLNYNKNIKLKQFIFDYDLAVKFYINYLWNNKVSFGSKILDIKNNKLDCPQFLSTKNIVYKTNLSARALSQAITQACAFVSSALEKRKRKAYVLEKIKSEGKRTRKLTKLLKKEILIKPDPKFIYPELNSLCSKVEISNIRYFDSILILKSLGKSYGKIIIPFNHNYFSRKLESKGKLLSGLQISDKEIFLRYELKNAEIKTSGSIVGADTGINSVVTLSDKQSSKVCNHNHSLNSILQKISKRTKGSKAFYKAIAHRDNYINWSVNQLNFTNIKEVRLEKISNFRKGKRTSKFLNYFGESLIRSKLLDKLQELGVQVKEESSAYRSQRCSSCSFVYKGNRKNKLFSCKHCFFSADADYNASLNHENYLPSANFLLYYLDKPKKFFWKEEGFFNLDGSELIVPDTKKKIL